MSSKLARMPHHEIQQIQNKVIKHHKALESSKGMGGLLVCSNLNIDLARAVKQHIVNSKSKWEIKQ